MDFDRLVRQHKDAVYRQMVRVCGNHEDAEDALVEALLAAHRALPKLRDKSAFRGWLAIVGRRACSRIKRHDALHPVLSLDLLGDEMVGGPLTEEPGDTHGVEEMTGQIKAVVNDLPKPLGEVYVRRALDGKSTEETAKTLGISEGAVKSRLHRARTLVREALDIKLPQDKH
jgi:RNA polymerase sigma-70 factor, ECF subfamily